MNHIGNREEIIRVLQESLQGPSTVGKKSSFVGDIHFESKEEFYQPYLQENGEEIIQRDSPIILYGVGVLYPMKQGYDELSQEGTIVDAVNVDEVIHEEFTKASKEIIKRAERSVETDGDDNFDLPTTNAFKPSSMSISFLADLPDEAIMKIEISGGQYSPKKVTFQNKEPYKWWFRKALDFEFEVPVAELLLNRKVEKTFEFGQLKLGFEVITRKYQDSFLLTATLINRTEGSTGGDIANEKSLFQSRLKVSVQGKADAKLILPYPKAHKIASDEEEDSLDLLYRKKQTYAIGHGCAADWEESPNASRALAVWSASLPIYETPSITPDIKKDDGSPLEVPMLLLAGLVKGEDGFEKLSEVIEAYESWILRQEKAIDTIGLKPYKKAAKRHVLEAKKVVTRMRAGLEYLKSNLKAKRAFQLANHAMLLQQIQSKQGLRKVEFDPAELRFLYSPEYSPPDLFGSQNPNLGKWRAFQIAFILMSLKSSVDGSDVDRARVELVWFPTGGGKTEAYLGLAAFSIFMRRLNNPSDVGTHVLMRYTLRLLTAQQFQRAASLICAMEYLRQDRWEELGESQFSIGIWLGAATTPNQRKSAEKALKDLERNAKNENPFVLNSCPWCSAPMGVYSGKMSKSLRSLKILGYKRSSGTVTMHCPDKNCPFHNSLPVYVIDEDIYEHKPTLLIGTVDKFAVLSWKPEARSIFGINKDGQRVASPPGLIIQDELHLISGPLGSMVGLYEALIEELCTDRRSGGAIAPKIVCSTATIRSYKHQIKALYNREEVTLFPPPGLEDGDSFFAKYARDEATGELLPGKKYIGIFAPGLRSIETTQARSFAALLHAPMHLSPEERDPWWTLLVFFGGLRELGTSLSLLQTDVPNYLQMVRNQSNVEHKRRLMQIEELTGRLKSEEVPKALAKLEVVCTDSNMWSPNRKAKPPYPVDVCLASSIIEVGVDIDRLSLMTVVGQPKTTSQYIQVTGRVGRKWWERPGLVVTLYNPKRARDISHYEHFRSYHEKLYAQVEPTSVTPFSPSLLDRALHGVMVGYAMQSGSEAVQESPDPYPERLVDEIRAILEERVQSVDPEEKAYFEQVFDKRSKEWQSRERTRWFSNTQSEDTPLMIRAGTYVTDAQAKLAWKTPNSMRNVDAECQAEITQLYVLDREED